MAVNRRSASLVLENRDNGIMILIQRVLIVEFSWKVPPFMGLSNYWLNPVHSFHDMLFKDNIKPICLVRMYHWIHANAPGFLSSTSCWFSFSFWYSLFFKKRCINDLIRVALHVRIHVTKYNVRLKTKELSRNN